MSNNESLIYVLVP